MLSAELHAAIPLDSEALDINQLQQIMRLTGTPPASLISRMPSHEVRPAPPFAFPLRQLGFGAEQQRSNSSFVYRLSFHSSQRTASALSSCTPCFLSDSPCPSLQGFSECWTRAVKTLISCAALFLMFEWLDFCVMSVINWTAFNALTQKSELVFLSRTEWVRICVRICKTFFSLKLFTPLLFRHRQGTTSVHFPTCPRGTLLMCLLVPTLLVSFFFFSFLDSGLDHRWLSDSL